MPLLAPTRPGWFETLERQVHSTTASISVAVFHPELSGRVRFEGGRFKDVRCSADVDEATAEQRLRGLGEGGYFEIRRTTEPLQSSKPVVVCAEPQTMHGAACTERERHELLDAVLHRRFREALATYTRYCATCRSRESCDSVATVERNAPRLLLLTSAGTEDTLT